jgi:hypothetical protein
MHLLLPFWRVFPSVTRLYFCISRKGTFTSISVRIAVPLSFLLSFALAFLSAALGKGRTSSGVKDVLEEGFVSAGVVLEGPGSGE